MSTHPQTLQPHPTVLVFAGNDPTGGAGISADIEAIASVGCHAAPVITAIAPQDTTRVKQFECLAPTLMIEQALSVLEDMPVSAIKIGMMGSLSNVEAIHSLLIEYPDLPVVLDPVLASGAGDALADNNMIDAIRDLLLPVTTVLTPNSIEARKLAYQSDDLDACAQELLSLGSDFVLITGTHEKTNNVINTLYSEHRKLQEQTWPRLPDSYHGSGCTLSSSIAGLLAQGMEPFSAIHEAQRYTWETLQNGYKAGSGQLLPNRFYWANKK
ncbi:MAG: hydroxymethylpyrimidine/phosphomethylpyrimidine kinase [Gammaproteobacteria bacterium]|nr:hydroxymethylpyrimidine/phosphomethylpyrimidine kinase [Gammaproteobacteria bacterium]MDH5593724.1 hydroxymethylpyrimidine/phosphomethylpyrimidine kinase [Gammaproteobacteria bacterium]